MAQWICDRQSGAGVKIVVNGVGTAMLCYAIVQRMRGVMVDRIQRLLFRSRVMQGELVWARNLATATEIRIVTWRRQWGSLGMKRTELPLEYKRRLGRR